LLLSNISVLILVIWLTPQFVLFESIAWVIISSICLFILYQQDHLKMFYRIISQNSIILPFILFAGASIIWSTYWQISLWRWLILISTVITGGFVAIRYDLKDIIKILTIFGVYILILSTLLVLFVPALGVMNYHSIQGAWKGLFWHKNHMGIIASFFNMIFLFNMINYLPLERKYSTLSGVFYMYSLFVIYQSDSVGAYMTTILLHTGIGVALLLRRYQSKLHRTHYYLFFALVVIFSIVILLNINGILALFNRNTSLTGRIPMWGYLFGNYFSSKPLFGYGFNAFWYAETHRIFLQHAAGYPDPIVIADNGFIDLMINNGLIGFSLFIIFYIGTWWRSVKVAFGAKEFSDFLPLALMAFSLVANLSWSLIFENENFLMLVIIAVLLRITQREQVVQTRH
jgi:O-antigen ligase